MSIRTFPKLCLTADKLLAGGAMAPPMLNYLTLAVQAQCNGLISGGTGSGKTTLLNVISSFIGSDERVVSVEDTKELQLTCNNWVSLEAAQRRSLEAGAQQVTMALLIKTCLRLRPDRILVGEIRDGEAAKAFLHAVNTGHRGTLSTLHANHCTDAVNRMTLLVAEQGSLSFDTVHKQVAANLNFLAHVERLPEGRKLVELAEVRQGEVVPLWQWDYRQRHWVCHQDSLNQSAVLAQAQTRGFSIPSTLAHERACHAVG